MEPESFFDEFTSNVEAGLQRDRYGRPLLVPDGAPNNTRAPYTRASSLADYIANRWAINRWEKRYLAMGLGRRPDLAMMAAAEVYNTGFGQEDKASNRASGARLDDIIRQAEEYAGIHEKANWGTAVHLFTEPGNPNRPPIASMAADVDTFFPTLAAHGFVIRDTELFCANDELMAAGTFDHLCWHPRYGHVTTDKKTGALHPFEFIIQLAVYNGADLYDPVTDERRPQPEDLNREVGFIFHIPALGARTEVYKINLEFGREMAQLAAAVRDGQRNRDISTQVTSREAASMRTETMRWIHLAITLAESEEEIRGVYADFESIWDETCNNVAQLRLTELVGSN